MLPARVSLTQTHTLFLGWAESYGDVYTVQLGELVVVFTSPKDCKVSTTRLRCTILQNADAITVMRV
jgi:hypothetical protein